MKTLPLIHKEHFEAWLFSQPDKREFDYQEPHHCLIGSFLNESFEGEYSCSTDYSRWNGITRIARQPFPEWFKRFADEVAMLPRFFTIGEARTIWRSLFPEQPFPAVRQEQTAMDDARMGSCSSVAAEVRA